MIFSGLRFTNFTSPKCCFGGLWNKRFNLMEVIRVSDELKSLQFVDLSLTINGQSWEGNIPVEETLLEFVRNRLGLTGTKRSCESEVCGACTVLIDNQAVSSCN